MSITALPAAAAIARAVAAALSNEKNRKTVGQILAIVLSPVALFLVLISSLLSGTTDHNHAAVNACFYGSAISENAPDDYRAYIADMQNSFVLLDEAITKVNGQIGVGGSLDPIRIKAAFYAIFFGAESPSNVDHAQFVDCFVDYEEHAPPPEEDGTAQEPYTIAIPVADLAEVYRRIANVLGLPSENNVFGEAQRIYALSKYGPGAVDLDGIGDPGEPIGDGSYQALIQEGEKYIGFPYVWGGSTPSTSFDCSGFVCWVYTQSGVHSLPRTTAQGIFNQCDIVPRSEAQPGDLIFFTKTYLTNEPVTHIGIYVGVNQMLHCGDPIGYASTDSSYWAQHFYAFGRLRS